MGDCSSAGLFNDTEESYSLLEAEGYDEEDDVLYYRNNDKYVCDINGGGLVVEWWRAAAFMLSQVSKDFFIQI